MRKNIFSKYLPALILGLGIVLFPVKTEAAQNIPYFSDVYVTSWYYENVMDISVNGYMQGVGENHFQPDENLTRGMMVTILGRMAGITIEDYSLNTYFEDVSSEDWYGPYVTWAKENGITEGMSSSIFAPDVEINREQMVTFCARFVDVMGWNLQNEGKQPYVFYDDDKISEWAKESMELMYHAGIVQGDDYGRFLPKDTATRAQIAAVISRLCESAGIEGNTYPDMRYIIHAAGTIDDISGTNSLQALERAYAAGNRTIEIDFNFTSDGYLACFHDRSAWWWWYPEFQQDGLVPTLSEFLQMKSYGKYTTMWLDSLVRYMKEHPDLYIVTDVKDDNILAAQVIARYFPEMLDRFIVQIYAPEQYDIVSELGYSYIIYTLYQTSWENIMNPEYLADYAETHTLLGYTFNVELLEYEAFRKNIQNAGIPYYTHTVNELDEQKECFDFGVQGIYTDNIVHK